MEKPNLKKTLIICYSYHHHNTLKIANAMAHILDAKVITPEEINHVDLADYDLIGFGAGIAGGRHYKPLLSFAEQLAVENKKCSFIFSTSAIQGDRKVTKDHSKLRTILTSKGYSIIDEFACKGFNTNSFMKYLGGMNKGRPNADDLKNAEAFASKLNVRI